MHTYPNWLSPAQIKMDDLLAILDQEISLDDLDFASALIQQVPVYDAPSLVQHFDMDPTDRSLRAAQSEWKWVWESGPGILVFRRAFLDTEVLDQVTRFFDSLVAREKSTVKIAGDHFARPGANERIWNALEKLCLESPDLFARYYSNEILALAATAWLGPGYQITSQVNSVKPGGEAQVAHRDYHLGFMTPDQVVQYPEHVHRLSPLMTLQCAVAHVDMPLESGPTLYLPHSQKYPLGYLLADYQPFHEYFGNHRIQLPLEKGDLVMFNPALLHAAGSNTSNDIKRVANLLQISSPFGRAMESVDRYKMINTLYPVIVQLAESNELSAKQIRNVIAASAEGYTFPTNLDRDPPIDGLAPPSQQAITYLALAEHWTPEQFTSELLAHRNKRNT